MKEFKDAYIDAKIKKMANTITEACDILMKFAMLNEATNFDGDNEAILNAMNTLLQNVQNTNFILRALSKKKQLNSVRAESLLNLTRKKIDDMNEAMRNVKWFGIRQPGNGPQAQAQKLYLQIQETISGLVEFLKLPNASSDKASRIPNFDFIDIITPVNRR